MYIYYYYGLGANDSNQAKGGTALGNEPDDEGEKVGGDEAMEPNFESLGRSRGGDDDEDDGCDGCRRKGKEKEVNMERCGRYISILLLLLLLLFE